jgi:hypothetical protein
MGKQKPSRRHSLERRRHRRRKQRQAIELNLEPSDQPAVAPFVCRARVLATTPARLASVAKSFGLTRSRLTGRILDWFARQPQPIQAAVAGQLPYGRDVDFRSLLLRRLLRP